jgi:hypothetical protein
LTGSCMNVLPLRRCTRHTRRQNVWTLKNVAPLWVSERQGENVLPLRQCLRVVGFWCRLLGRRVDGILFRRRRRTDSGYPQRQNIFIHMQRSDVAAHPQPRTCTTPTSTTTTRCQGWRAPTLATPERFAETQFVEATPRRQNVLSTATAEHSNRSDFAATSERLTSERFDRSAMSERFLLPRRQNVANIRTFWAATSARFCSRNGRTFGAITLWSAAAERSNAAALERFWAATSERFGPQRQNVFGAVTVEHLGPSRFGPQPQNVPTPQR